ncbi:MAG: HAD family hydrolase [Pseudomonadales bacterium]
MEDLPGQHGPMYMWPEVRLVEGVVDCLHSLNKVAKCHVATNAKDSTATEIRKAFARVELSQYIEEIFCANSIGHKKPSSEYFEFIQIKLGAPKSKIVIIGDSLENDVYGALQQGFNAIWFNRNEHDVPAGINAIGELKELLPA